MIVKDNGKGQVTRRNKQTNKYFSHYSKNPHERTTIFQDQAGKGHLPGHFAQTVGKGRGNVIKLWSEITSGSSTIC